MLSIQQGDKLSFDTFHSNDVINELDDHVCCQRISRIYTELYEVAESFEGRPILQMTITNKATGKDTDKPGAYFEGNRHSGEITSAESSLWLINYLLTELWKEQ